MRTISNNKIKIWFAVWLAATVILIAVTQPDSRPDKLDHVGFSTTESAELYFKNVRAYHYFYAREGGDIFDVYRLKALFSGGDPPVLPFTVYNNWRVNEAFVRLDTAYLDARFTAAVIDSAGSGARAVSFPEMYNESQYLFAVEVYRALRDEKELGLFSPSKDTLWIRGEQRKALKRTLTDYFKLTGSL